MCVCVIGICGGRQGGWDEWLKGSMLWNSAASPAFVCAWRKGWGRGRQEQEDRLLGFLPSRRGGVERCIVAARLSRREQRVASSCSAGQALWRAARCVVGRGRRGSQWGCGSQVATQGAAAAAKTRLRPHRDDSVSFSRFFCCWSRGAVYSVFGEDGTELALIPFPPVSPPPWRLSPQAKWSRLGVNPASGDDVLISC